MPAAPCPGRGTARRLMSRGRLGRAKAVREESPLLGRGHRTWRYGADRERIGGPFAGSRPRSTDSGKPTSEAFGAGAGRGRHGKPQGKPHRMRLKRLPGRGETPARTPPVEAARSPRRHFRHRFQGSGRAREPPPPAKFPQKRTPQARTKAPFPRRERTAPLGRRTRRRAGLPNPSSRRRNEARAASRPRRAAIPVTGPPLSGSPFAAWTTPTEPGARGPMPGERFTPADDPALSRDK